jgi:hypothetical protein
MRFISLEKSKPIKTELKIVLIYYLVLYKPQQSIEVAVAQLVEVLRDKLESSGFDSRWGHWSFTLTYSFRPHHGLRQKWVPEISP